jgi:hypothetical protein
MVYMEEEHVGWEPLLATWLPIAEVRDAMLLRCDAVMLRFVMLCCDAAML